MALEKLTASYLGHVLMRTTAKHRRAGAILAFTFLLLALVVVQTATTDTQGHVEDAEEDMQAESTRILSPAEEILNAARKAGYNLTLEVYDQAVASTDEEVEEMMPAPVAEAFISHRRRDNVDLIREQMIGMIFTGTPQPLGFRPRRPPPPPRSRPNFRINNPNGRLTVPYNPQGEDSIQHTRKVPAPENILKPLPFVPGPTMVKFPPHHKPPQSVPLPPRQPSGPRLRPRPTAAPKDSFHHVGDNFGNAVGPDFGPVSFTEFGNNNNFGFNNNFENDFKDFGQKPVRPPPPHSVPRPRPEPVRPVPHDTFGIGGGRENGCVKYTEDICLDATDYPHEAILSSLIRDPSRSDTMIAEVRTQSADDLVDGVSSTQESKYDYQHYFGNRRQGTENHAHRDFARDGGYLCPSEVKYARPKRARNSKGKWKYIVNMDKYSQTIRMEKCMKPGGACSYVSHHYRATCNQVYNYHRLLSWEDGRGLHMDIFKVPSCCSCHIQGYAYVFPPLNRRQQTSGSVQVSQRVPVPNRDANELAPGSNISEEAYSPVNYPNVPPVKTVPRRRPGVRGQGPNSGLRNITHSVNRSRPEEMTHFGNSGGSKPNGNPILIPDRSGFSPNFGSPDSRRRRPIAEEDDRVNYGYHPIIDFFNPYR
ncbi:Neurotrophin 1 Source FlyBase [Halocaridina rubra]|uniref:Neurotrophin 1 Source FlyBase n=1 Tax=Halocaridina rubra TaxID=373956 RepID=A0AAN8XPV1_HALRR